MQIPESARFRVPGRRREAVVGAGRRSGFEVDVTFGCGATARRAIGSRGGSGTASGVAAPTARVFNNQALLETRDQATSRGTFSQGSDNTSGSTTTESTSSPNGGSSPNAPSSPSSPGPVSSPNSPSPSPTPAPSGPLPTPAPTPAPTPTPPSRPDADAVPIPELARWKTQMVSYGQKACLQYASATLTEDQRLGGTYYDATRVYEQIADYTGDAVWDDCAANAKASYRGYVLRNNGAVPGYWNFTSGFRMDWERNAARPSLGARRIRTVWALLRSDGVVAWRGSRLVALQLIPEHSRSNPPWSFASHFHRRMSSKWPVPGRNAVGRCNETTTRRRA